ncbi:hypothetical protein K2Y11_19190 [bacterium]|nr:hypothetical protein [bacterium]
MTAAIEGRSTPPVDQHRGRWIVDGNKEWYSLIPLPNPDSIPPEGGVCVLENDNHVLLGEDLAVTYTKKQRVVNVFDSRDKGFGIRVSPFNVDLMGRNEYSNPSRYLNDCLSGRFTGHYLGEQVIQGMNCVVVKVDTPIGVVTFGFDPTKNFALRYQADDRRDAGRIYEVFITDYQPVGEAWFPFRTVVVLRPGNGAVEVNEIKVTLLDTDTAIKDEEFRFDIDANTNIAVAELPYQRTTRQRETITLRDFRSLLEKYSIIPQETHKGDR